MDQREEPCADAVAGRRIYVSMAAPCAWPPKREYAPTRAGRIAALTAWMPVAVPVR